MGGKIVFEKLSVWTRLFENREYTLCEPTDRNILDFKKLSIILPYKAKLKPVFLGQKFGMSCHSAGLSQYNEEIE